MQKNHISKTLALGIIVLFISVGIHPAFAVDTKQFIVNNQSKDDCGFGEVRNTDLIKVESLLNRVEVYSNLLLVLSKNNFELSEFSEKLSNEISTLIGMFEKLTEDRFPIICNISLGLFKQFENLVFYFDNLAYYYQKNPVLSSIADICAGIMDFFAISIYFIAREFGCEWAPDIYPPP